MQAMSDPGTGPPRPTIGKDHMNARQTWVTARTSTAVFFRDVGSGLLEVSHNTLALLGLAVVAALIFMGGTHQVRDEAEGFLFGWLQDRREQRAEQDGNLLAAVAEPQASKRATALDPTRLSREQQAVTNWLSRKYRVAQEPVSRLVHEAWQIAPRAKLDPALIMAVVAVESSFNPFAQSVMGAQGLMQVMRRVHDDKFEAFGGSHAAFDPVANLKVGVQILRDCVTRFGGIEDGLRCYVGATHPDTEDNGYVQKVQTEFQLLRQVIEGRMVPVNLPRPAQQAPRVALSAQS